MGKCFITKLTKIKLKIWRVTFLKSLSSWTGPPISAQYTIFHVRTDMRQSLDCKETKAQITEVSWP